MATNKSDFSRQYDVVIVGSTPGGIMAGIAVAQSKRRVVILERSLHIGGLPANGLGATDIATRGATEGLFTEFTRRIKQYYVDTYGENSPQVKDCSDGYHFEPSVAEQILLDMVGEHSDYLTILYQRQFDAEPSNAIKEGTALKQIKIKNRETNEIEIFSAQVFVDATYEGDVAAAAGAPYMLGREGKEEYDEPCAGKLYKRWRADEDPYYSTGQGDNAIQSYNYRLTLTTDKSNMTTISKPETYNRTEYVSLIEDVLTGRNAGPPDPMEFDGIGRITNMVNVPNHKVDANNQHAAFISTDLPEENWAWPTASWDWRDNFAKRLRDYILGLFYFAQNDKDLPQDFREKCNRWGLASNEYVDNDNFPRQVYVREGRRIRGEYLFTAHDSRSKRGSRDHMTSITASHYNLDSHAVLKREPNRPHLDGFFGIWSKPYNVPYGVMVPLKVDNLLTPVPASATHIGFSTLRMEPCWMALGQAAGTAICVALDTGTSVRNVDILEVQRRLVDDGAVLTYYEDVTPSHAQYKALQFFALRGFLGDSYVANLSEQVSGEDRNNWTAWAGADDMDDFEGSRGELLQALYDRIRQLPSESLRKIYAE